MVEPGVVSAPADKPQALAPYAALDAHSRGRLHAEPEHPYRGRFQRDRDRIVHATAFRRLVYKTQVFVNHEGDMYRTRLTHSLEVAQIARTVAQALGLHEQLIEAICLAHDLGHTPFGHAGQEALHARMRAFGGFEHNLQSLRVVDELEERYPDFPGLNLTFETREGILKHCSASNARRLGDVGLRFLEGGQPGLEAQLANLADEIAYNHHDVDDGLRAGLLNLDDLKEVRLFGELYTAAREDYAGMERRRLISETVRRMIDRVATDLVETTRERLREEAPRDIDEVRSCARPLASFSDGLLEQHRELKRFLRQKLYQHYRVLRMTNKARTVVTALFDAYFDDVRLMPPEHAARCQEYAVADGEAGRARGVADYIAGMTDRFAISEYSRLFDPAEST